MTVFKRLTIMMNDGTPAEEPGGGTMTTLHNEEPSPSQVRDRLVIWLGAALVSLALWGFIIMAGAAVVHAVLS